MKLLLIPLSWLYTLAITVRHKFYDWKLIKSEEYDIPVVCVGNLTVGGTGKTPMAEFLISHFSRQGYHVALLSRGYRRSSRGYLEILPSTSCADAGDEPKQIKLKFPQAVVAVCKDRREGIDTIRRDHPDVNMVILDDAFQYRRVEPWVNILLMDYTRPVYRDHMLPWGRLRDSLSQMGRAHFVVVTKCPVDITPLNIRIVTKNLGLFPYQSLYFSAIGQGSITPLFAGTPQTSVLTGQKMIVMAGIANPSPMIASLKEKYEVVDTIIFPDHHPYSVRDLVKIEKKLAEAPDGTIIVTTEKDAVRLMGMRNISADVRARLYFLPIKVNFINNGGAVFLHKLNNNVKSNPKYGLLH